jgi:S-disulfanyl-L-cysteine oxidoreductase SoxD
MIPPRGYFRRVVITLVILTIPLLLGLIFTVDIIKVNWSSNMEDQQSIDYQEGPRKSAPAQAKSFIWPSMYVEGSQAANPVSPDPVSLDRGHQLYVTNCLPCHGEQGQGDGPITKYWKPDMRKPANLSDPKMRDMSEGSIYVTITQGYGAMPPLSENVNVRERWDLVNYVKTLSR